LYIAAKNRQERTEIYKPGSEHSGWPYLMHDHVIRPDICNMRCAYCGLTTELCPPWLRNGSYIGLDGGINGPRRMEHVTAVADRVERQIAQIQKYCSPPLVKLSGGELTLVPEWMEVLYETAQKVPHVQLLTNGTLLDEVLVEKIALLGNVSVQVSLDGITPESNRYRGIDVSQLNRIVAMVALLLTKGVTVEINAVLTSASIMAFSDLAEWAASLADGDAGLLAIIPRPVKGNVPSEMRIGTKMAEQFAAIQESLPPEVLPPKAYMSRLCEMLLNGKRSWPCYVPFFVLGAEDNGGIPICTCGTKLGAAGTLSNERPTIVDSPDASRWHPRCEVCSDCMSPYEIFNLLLEGKIDPSELRSLPSFNHRSFVKKAATICNMVRQRQKDNYKTIPTPAPQVNGGQS
jgi:uncharacterized Fe-S cluster-containing radical SAM superfamily protein